MNWPCARSVLALRNADAPSAPAATLPSSPAHRCARECLRRFCNILNTESLARSPPLRLTKMRGTEGKPPALSLTEADDPERSTLRSSQDEPASAECSNEFGKTRLGLLSDYENHEDRLHG